jgi:choline transport protein
MVTALATFNYDTYVPKPWHTTLIMWGFILVPVIFNFWFRKLINAIELLGGLFHFIFFIVSVITLIVSAQRSTPDFVFKTLTRGESGWDNPGVSFGLGLLTITYSVSGQPWYPLQVTS